MKILSSIFMIILVASSAMAQSEDALRKIESARIALITERLDLTPEQAEKFWPLYREYAEKRQQLRQEFMAARGSVQKEGITNEESKRLIDKGLELKERQLNLDKDYSTKFDRVITARQLLQLRQAEDDFRKMLLERLSRRRDQRDRLDNREERRKNNN